jgi:predicted nucleic acid-binding protein
MVGGLMYLADTNLIAEILLRQTKAGEVKRFLESTAPEGLYLTEFSLYSLGIILLRRKMHDTFLQTVDDLLLTGGIRLVRLGLEDMQDIVHASRRFNLDFDDAYQYVAAEKYNLIIVSFDSDFDRTERGRRTPTEVLQG